MGLNRHEALESRHRAGRGLVGRDERDRTRRLSRQQPGGGQAASPRPKSYLQVASLVQRSGSRWRRIRCRRPGRVRRGRQASGCLEAEPRRRGGSCDQHVDAEREEDPQDPGGRSLDQPDGAGQARQVVAAYDSSRAVIKREKNVTIERGEGSSKPRLVKRADQPSQRRELLVLEDEPDGTVNLGTVRDRDYWFCRGDIYSTPVTLTADQLEMLIAARAKPPKPKSRPARRRIPERSEMPSGRATAASARTAVASWGCSLTI